jgi:ribosomal protein S18 acetylase RimI-like enzyme
MNTDIDLTITRGETSDIDAIVRFQADMAMESEGIMLDMCRLTSGVTSAMKDESKGTYLVARANGTPIGSLMLTREWSDWNNQWYWWIQSVYVMPEYRNQGIYRAMYTTLKDMARESGVSQIRLYADKSNVSAQHVYKRLGMHESHYLMFEEKI